MILHMNNDNKNIKTNDIIRELIRDLEYERWDAEDNIYSPQNTNRSTKQNRLIDEWMFAGLDEGNATKMVRFCIQMVEYHSQSAWIDSAKEVWDEKNK